MTRTNLKGWHIVTPETLDELNAAQKVLCWIGEKNGEVQYTDFGDNRNWTEYLYLAGKLDN